MRPPPSASRRPGSAAPAAVALAVVTVLAALFSTAGVAQVTASKCTTSRLVIWLNTTGNGTAGSTFYNLYFTNLSRRTCSLKGYPGVSAVDLSGRRLGRAASREASQTPAAVTLRPGGTATAVLRLVDPGNFSAAACNVVTAAGLRVYPPRETRSKVVPFPFKTCSRSAVGGLSVRAVTP
jgi:uncharacterized protein DUF4232